MEEAATQIVSEVRPALSALASKIEALQQQQSTLMQTLQESPFLDKAAIEKVETTIAQVTHSPMTTRRWPHITLSGALDTGVP